MFGFNYKDKKYKFEITENRDCSIIHLSILVFEVVNEYKKTLIGEVEAALIDDFYLNKEKVIQNSSFRMNLLECNQYALNLLELNKRKKVKYIGHILYSDFIKEIAKDFNFINQLFDEIAKLFSFYEIDSYVIRINKSSLDFSLIQINDFLYVKSCNLLDTDLGILYKNYKAT